MQILPGHADFAVIVSWVWYLLITFSFLEPEPLYIFLRLRIFDSKYGDITGSCRLCDNHVLSLKFAIVFPCEAGAVIYLSSAPDIWFKIWRYYWVMHLLRSFTPNNLVFPNAFPFAEPKPSTLSASPALWDKKYGDITWSCRLCDNRVLSLVFAIVFLCGAEAVSLFSATVLWFIMWRYYRVMHPGNCVQILIFAIAFPCGAGAITFLWDPGFWILTL